METVLTFLLIRFALIAAVVVVLALALFTVAVVLRRRGRGEQVAHLTRSAARFASDRLAERGAGGGVRGSVSSEAARRLADGAGRLGGDRR